MPVPGHKSGLYEALLKAKEMGKTRFIGITNHKLNIANDAVLSGLYDTVQFPLSSISSQEDLALIELCKKHNIGLIAMKALSGGLITNAASAFTFLRQYENVVPIWGIQREWELDEFISLEGNPPNLDQEMIEIIEKEDVYKRQDINPTLSIKVFNCIAMEGQRACPYINYTLSSRNNATTNSFFYH